MNACCRYISRPAATPPASEKGRDAVRGWRFRGRCGRVQGSRGLNGTGQPGKLVAQGTFEGAAEEAAALVALTAQVGPESWSRKALSRAPRKRRRKPAPLSGKYFPVTPARARNGCIAGPRREPEEHAGKYSLRFAVGAPRPQEFRLPRAQSAQARAYSPGVAVRARGKSFSARQRKPAPLAGKYFPNVHPLRPRE